jgi:hypothetical protein
MESIFQRLKYYGVGFGIGLFFVLFFFQNRGCSWLPGNRVKNSILDRVLVLPDSEIPLLKKYGMTRNDLAMVLNDGEVLYDESQKKGNPKVYVIQKTVPIHGKMKFYFTLADESFISEIHFSTKNGKKIGNTTKGFGELISFPADENLVYPDSSKQVSCQQEQLNLINPKDILKLLGKSGKIDFSKSSLKTSPKPEHYLLFTDRKGNVIGCNVIWYKNKLNITNFTIPFENDCK